MICTIQKNASGAIYIFVPCFSFLLQSWASNYYKEDSAQFHSFPCHVLNAFCMKFYLILQPKYLCVYLFQALQWQNSKASKGLLSHLQQSLDRATWYYRLLVLFGIIGNLMNLLLAFDFDTHQPVTIPCA